MVLVTLTYYLYNRFNIMIGLYEASFICSYFFRWLWHLLRKPPTYRTSATACWHPLNDGYVRSVAEVAQYAIYVQRQGVQNSLHS